VATPQPASVSAISKGRLEMLVDGVFAIAMTILVLELKVPELADVRSSRELTRALSHEAPTFFSYLLSFAILGVFWFRHNHQYRHFRVITSAMLALHFVQLAAAAFFPFSAALYGRYPMNPGSIVVYLGCVTVYAWAAFATLLVARRSGALSEEMTPELYAKSHRRFLRWCLMMTVLLAIYSITAVASGR